jgi:hypothetical protein
VAASMKPIPYDKFIIKDREFEKKFNFTLSDLFQKDKDYLKGFKFFISDHVFPIKDEIEELIESANGKCVEKVAKDSIVICDKNNDRDQIKNLKNKNFKVYNVDLVLESVFLQELELNKAKYKL